MGPVRPQVGSEVSPLSAVVVHSPGIEFDFMWPQNVESHKALPHTVHSAPNTDYLLFDDLVLLPQLAREHAILTSVLTAGVGPTGQVIEVASLVRRALFDSSHRDDLIDSLSACEEQQTGQPLTSEHARLLAEVDPHRFVEIVRTGVDPETQSPVFRWPAPNLLFSRDLGAVVGQSLVLPYPRHPARAREMALMRWTWAHHPSTAGMLQHSLSAAGGPWAVEGGDVLVINERVVAIGVGHRTTWSAVEQLAPQLFAAGVEVVMVALLPEARYAMHLDTVFTLISHNQCLVYEPAIGLSHHAPGSVDAIRLDPQSDLRSPPRPQPGGWLEALRREGIDLEAFRCGGNKPVDQAREQWSDGANAFALAPGKILCYGRNLRTLEILNEAGYEIYTPKQFCRNARLLMAQPEPVAVILDGFELSRGRGGPRCLTFPLRREAAPP